MTGGPGRPDERFLIQGRLEVCKARGLRDYTGAAGRQREPQRDISMKKEGQNLSLSKRATARRNRDGRVAGRRRDSEGKIETRVAKEARKDRVIKEQDERGETRERQARYGKEGQEERD